MSKIKVIDLLNMISKGEEVPEKIRFDNTYWNRICGEKYPYYINDNDSDLFIYFFRKNLTFSLNDEVEIIEEPQEHKIPEKLESYISCGWAGTCKDLKREDLFNDLKKIGSKINEILDYLEVNNDRKGS